MSHGFKEGEHRGLSLTPPTLPLRHTDRDSVTLVDVLVDGRMGGDDTAYFLSH